MAISDLTGTKWKFNDTGLTTLPVGNYKIDANVSCSAGSCGTGTTLRKVSGTYLNYPVTYNTTTQTYQDDYPNIEYDFSSSRWFYRVSQEASASVVTDVIWDISGGANATNATLIAWFEANATQVVTPTVSVDLSTLSGWSDVTAGNHTLTIKAKASGYRDSDASAGVSFTKASSGYQVTVQAGNADFDYYIYDGENRIYTIEYDDTPHTVTITSGEMGIESNAGQWVSNGTVSGGVSIIGAGSYSVTGDGSVIGFYGQCLSGDTLVTMADRSTKRLDEIDLGDKVLSMDWATKELISRKVIYTDKDEGKSFGEFDRWIFEDGTEVKTVHRHEFYNDEKGGMAYMDEWNIGDHAYRIDGAKVALVKHETVKEEVRHYKISLEGDTNFFANGLLNGDRNCPKERL